MKTCIKCGNQKNINEFSWKRKSKNLRHNICKECKRKLDNTYYIDSEKRRTSIRTRAKIGYDYLTKYTQRVKKLSRCKKCNESRWYVLDFHHVNGKDYSISYLQHTGSMKLLKRELRKCIILCSNCHREEHFLLRNNNKRLWVGVPSFIWQEEGKP